jgi:hypothetical protein
MYVVVTTDSILVKKVQKDEKTTFVNLISLNPEYNPILVDRSEVRELWQVYSKLTFDMETNSTTISLHNLHHEMKELMEEVRKLVKE